MNTNSTYAKTNTTKRPSATINGENWCNGNGQPRRKPDFRPIPPGTTLLIDGANILGQIGQDDAARKFAKIANSLEAAQYRVVVFLENRAVAWCLHNQPTKAMEEALFAFCRDRRVSIVRDESDLAMLQTARAITDAVCVTNDRLKDYSGEFMEIVGTPRVRTFSSLRLDGRIFLSISGLREAIVMDECTYIPVAKPIVDVAASAPQTGTAPVEPGAGYAAIARTMLECGKIREAIRYLGKVATKDPKAYYDLAGIFADGIYTKPDAKRSKKYARLAEMQERRERDSERRDIRRRSWRRHGGYGYRAHRRTAALEISLFGKLHDDTLAYLKEIHHR